MCPVVGEAKWPLRINASADQEAIVNPMEWANVEAMALAQIAANSAWTLVIAPAGRLAARSSNRSWTPFRPPNDLRVLEAHLKEQISEGLPDLWKPIPNRQQAKVRPRLSTLFESPAFSGLIKQCMAVRLREGSSARDAKKYATEFLSILLRAHYTDIYIYEDVLLDPLADLVSELVEKTIEELHLVKHRSGGSDQRLALESLSAQNDSILRMLAVIAGSTMRIDEEFGTFASRYRTSIATTYSRIPTPHWDGAPKAPIEKTYVPARFCFHEDYEEVRQRILSDRLDQQETPGLPPPFTQPETTRVVVLGDPGAGKTTFAMSLVYSQVKTRKSREMPAARLPFMVTLRDYWKAISEPAASFTIPEFIADRCAEDHQLRVPAGLIEYELLSGSSLVVFDGLDEITNVEARVKCVERIEAFASIYPNTAVMVTSRRRGYENAPLDALVFDEFDIIPFSVEEMGTYVDSWFEIDDAIGPGKKERAKKGLLNNLLDLDRILTSNPLTLALLCNLYKAGNYQPLPKSRAEIYEKCSMMLYERWDSRRGIGSVDFERDFLPVLCHVADSIFTHSEFADGITEDQLITLCVEYLLPDTFTEEVSARRFSESLFSHCLGRAWVFSPVNTNNENQELYGFTHRTFLEYFAALHLARSYGNASDLAISIAPWVMKGERAVITQLAFEIKMRTQNNVARDFVHALLALEASSSESRQILDFLCQEAAFVPFGQSPMQEVIGRLLSTDNDREFISQCFSTLADAKGSSALTVDQQCGEYIKQIVASTSDTSELAWAYQVVLAFLMHRDRSGHSVWTELHKQIRTKAEHDQVLSQLIKTSRKSQFARGQIKNGPFGKGF